ncbi:MAG: hypothetical protein ABI696_15235 [Rubrivivax sp.]
MRTTFKPLTLLAAVSAAVVLAACGGGGGGSKGPGKVPSSALDSPEAFVDYVDGLKTRDDREPIEVADDMNPPTSETDEPVAVE